MRKNVRRSIASKRIVIISLVILLFALEFYGRENDVCWQCGARRDRYLFTILYPNWLVTKTELSKRVEKILEQSCSHKYWEYNYSSNILGHGDAFPQWDVPILFPKVTFSIDDIERLPKKEWRKAAMLAVGDKNNLLKYTAMLMLVDVRKDIYILRSNRIVRKKIKKKNWELWWGKNSEVFKRTVNPENTLKVAKSAIKRIDKKNLQYYTRILGKMGKNIPKLRK